MKLNNIVLMLTLLGVTPAALSLSSDREQPIEVTADMAELDDIKKISIYTGNVVVIQGSIRMTGDKMTVYHTENDDLETVIMVGKPATYRQLPDDSSVYDEAEALTIEYYELKNQIVLIDKAKIRQEEARYSAGRIEYDTLRSKVKAWGNVQHQQNGTGAPGPDQKERVKIILKPKSKECKDKTTGEAKDECKKQPRSQEQYNKDKPADKINE